MQGRYLSRPCDGEEMGVRSKQMTYKNQHTIGARPADLATVPRGSMKGWNVAGYDMCDAVEFFLPFRDSMDGR